MAFSLDQFYRLNRRALIWIILFILIWLLRDFFALIFLTFFFTFLAMPLIKIVRERLRLPRPLAITMIYGTFLILLIGFVRYVTPGVVAEANTLLRDLQQIEDKLIVAKEEMVDEYPSLNTFLNGYIRSALPEEVLAEPELVALEDELAEVRATIDLLMAEAGPEIGPIDSPDADGDRRRELSRLRQRQQELRGQQSAFLMKLFLNVQAAQIREQAPRLIDTLWETTLTILLALLFSFLISLDFTRLGRELKSLRVSRLHDFYEQAAQPVVRFAYVVGRAIQAQAMIACVNTFLTMMGLIALGIPSLAMLSLIVFVCSFIPVLGVFISTIPIVLVALNAHGLGLAIGAVVLVIVIHAVEAYVLNPLIYGRHLQLNPVFVLIILFIGHHVFGIWGMLLGVPVAHYFLHDVFGVPVWDDRRLAPAGTQPLSSLPSSESPPMTPPRPAMNPTPPAAEPPTAPFVDSA